LANGAVLVDDLALQVGELDVVKIDEHEFSYARRGQIECGR
jgi:hypothetical protein